MRSQAEPDYIDEILNFADEKELGSNTDQGDKDELYQQAVEIIRSEKPLPRFYRGNFKLDTTELHE